MISLTFDDALDQHLDIAVPLLDAVGLPGTFYAHLTAPSLSRRWRDWERVAAKGHELGNHTVFHPADRRKSWVQPGNALDDYTPDRMRRELECANLLLQGIDGRTERTFAYPCSNRILGHRGWVKRLAFRCGFERSRIPTLIDQWGIDVGSTEVDYSPLTLESCYAARAGGITLKSQFPPLDKISRSTLPSAAVESDDLATLQDFVRRGVEANSWPILQFHGIGGGHRMDCDKEVFRSLVEWLAENYRDQVVTVLYGAKRLWRQP